MAITNLAFLNGDWLDGYGSNYTIFPDEPNELKQTSCTVTCVRSDGSVRTTRGQIRLTDDNLITWGRGHGQRFSFEAPETWTSQEGVTECYRFVWASKSGGRNFTWTRTVSQAPLQEISRQQPYQLALSALVAPPLEQMNGASNPEMLTAPSAEQGDASHGADVHLCVFHMDADSFDHAGHEQCLEALVEVSSKFITSAEGKRRRGTVASLFVGVDVLHIHNTISVSSRDVVKAGVSGRGSGIDCPGLKWELGDRYIDNRDASRQKRRVLLERFAEQLRQAPPESIALVMNGSHSDVESSYLNLKDLGNERSPESSYVFLLTAGVNGFDGHGDVNRSFLNAMISLCSLHLGRNRVIQVDCDDCTILRTVCDARLSSEQLSVFNAASESSSVRLIAFLGLEIRRGFLGAVVAGAEARQDSIEWEDFSAGCEWEEERQQVAASGRFVPQVIRECEGTLADLCKKISPYAASPRVKKLRDQTLKCEDANKENTMRDSHGKKKLKNKEEGIAKNGRIVSWADALLDEKSDDSPDDWDEEELHEHRLPPPVRLPPPPPPPPLLPKRELPPAPAGQAPAPPTSMDSDIEQENAEEKENAEGCIELQHWNQKGNVSPRGEDIACPKISEDIACPKISEAFVQEPLVKPSKKKNKGAETADVVESKGRVDNVDAGAQLEQHLKRMSKPVSQTNAGFFRLSDKMEDEDASSGQEQEDAVSNSVDSKQSTSKKNKKAKAKAKSQIQKKHKSKSATDIVDLHLLDELGHSAVPNWVILLVPFILGLIATGVVVGVRGGDVRTLVKYIGL